MPDWAQGVFGDRLAVAERYVELLAGPGTIRGLIGPREGPRLWDRHLRNCAQLAALIPHGASVCDVGSGAGLPGIVLSILRPDLAMTMVEPLLRRTTFLQEVVDDLELSARVERGRAESLHGIETFDVVTSRAVAGLPTLIDWSMPLVDPHGQLLALKGRTAADELAQAAAHLESWGAGPGDVLSLGAEEGAEVTYIVRVPWRDPASVSWPPVGPPAVRRRPRRASPRKRKRSRE